MRDLFALFQTLDVEAIAINANCKHIQSHRLHKSVLRAFRHWTCSAM